ncbi:LytR/AlgR family response regulator transcription factor [Aquimarina hainanensis]|uniref:LytR/AlgR family response regulator transcription factor n=1 Tax=Aquimarina hainanensis TaxID=1578017 RepID=A0ABW5NDD8_9FLAO|nr:response regulator transcription factor [Aquimarina sp. TRL1]QKX06649.1 response regulator transcription factor [Aquimarina sp. TRL1]
MELKSVVIDDETLAIDVIKNYALQTKGIQITGTFTNAIEGMNFIKEHPVDLIFLDINMPLLDGLSLLKSLPFRPLVIITSAYEEYAVESFELEVLDYLVKPISFSRFIIAANKALKTASLLSQHEVGGITINERPFIFVKVTKKKMKKIYLDEILVIESLKDYIRIITATDEKHIIHQTLTSFTQELPREKFIRIHRSYTISVDKVDVIEGNSIEIEGVRYPIGRSYINEVKEFIINGSSNTP